MNRPPAPVNTAPSSTLLLPSTDRLLRGARTALAEMDLGDRPDLHHSARMIDMLLNHLLLRQELQPYAELYQQIRTLAVEGKRFLSSNADHKQLAARVDALGPQLDASLDFDAVQVRLGEAFNVVGDLMRLAVEARDQRYVNAVLATERDFYEANYRTVKPAPPVAEAIPLTRERFEPWLLQRAAGRYRGVVRFQRLTGGFQKETIVVDAELVAGGIESLVIRAEKHDRFVRFTASEITDEFEIVRLLWDNGIAVAEPLWLEADASLLGRRFMVSRRVQGRNTGDAMGSAGMFPAELTRSLVQTLANIHNTPLDERLAATKAGDWLKYKTLPENTLQEIRHWRHQIWLDRAPPSPGFTRIFDWLEANVPTDNKRACVLHNDYGPHNILVDGNSVAAVLDWEIAKIGDPAEDVAFFIQCCAGAVSRDEVVTLYRQLSGNDVSEYQLRYFDVLSGAKVLVSALSATTLYQATDPALVDWCQMPILWFILHLRQVEDKIQIAEAARGK